MLNDIYLLLPQDIIDFNTLNALPANSQGPQVTPMSYVNSNNKSSVKMNLIGVPDAIIPLAFMFTDAEALNTWIISSPVTLDGSGNATNVYAECLTQGEITGLVGTLTEMITFSPNLTSITNPFDAVVSGEEFDNCIDKSTVDDPLYQPWKDAMEANQPISTREIITITMG